MTLVGPSTVENKLREQSMQHPTADIERKLNIAFANLRQEPFERFLIKLRQTRAQELRELLSNPNSINLEEFNREVWVLERRTSLGGQDIGKIYTSTTNPSLEKIQQLETALESGELDLHGNYIWGTGANAYGT
jgi:hypothetical protein